MLEHKFYSYSLKFNLGAWITSLLVTTFKSLHIGSPNPIAIDELSSGDMVLLGMSLEF